MFGNVWECRGCVMSYDKLYKCAVHRATPSTTGIAPGQELGTCVVQTWMFNIFRHISSYFVIFQRHRTSCSHPFPAHPILLVPSKSFEHPQSSGLLGSAIVTWHVVTSPCQSEGEPVRICQNWQAGSTPVWLPVPKALLAAKLLERLLPWI